MDSIDRRALVLALVDSLKSSGSWCGDTHVQKSCYVLQTLLDFPTGFDFILYKHGPFAFDFQEFMHGLRADDLIASIPTDLQYGTSLVVTAQGRQIINLRSELVNQYGQRLKAVTERLGKKTVRDLEKIATAFHATQELGKTASIQDRAKRITYYKKHVSLEDAEGAIKEADQLAVQFAAAI